MRWLCTLSNQGQESLCNQGVSAGVQGCSGGAYRSLYRWGEGAQRYARTMSRARNHARSARDSEGDGADPPHTPRRVRARAPEPPYLFTQSRTPFGKPN